MLKIVSYRGLFSCTEKTAENKEESFMPHAFCLEIMQTFCHFAAL